MGYGNDYGNSDRSSGYGGSSGGGYSGGGNNNNSYGGSSGGGYGGSSGGSNYSNNNNSSNSNSSSGGNRPGLSSEKKMDMAYETGYKDAMDKVKEDLMGQIGGGNNNSRR